MPRRRGSTRRDTSTPSNRRVARGGIRKNTRSRQAPSRYGQPPTQTNQQPGRENTSGTSSESGDKEPSDSEYRHSSSTHTLQHIPGEVLSRAASCVTPATSSEPDTIPAPVPSPDGSINLYSMRELLRSHEQDIVDRVVLRLSSQQICHSPPSQPNPEPQQFPEVATLAPRRNATLTRITELESQLAKLRQEHNRQQQAPSAEQSIYGMYNPTFRSMDMGGESASGIAESVETLFPGVELSMLIQIIENQFKPTNIYRLLATENDRAESQRTISIGGVEFEQAERDGKCNLLLCMARFPEGDPAIL